MTKDDLLNCLHEIRTACGGGDSVCEEPAEPHEILLLVKRTVKKAKEDEAGAAAMREYSAHISEYWNGAEDSAVDAAEYCRHITQKALGAINAGRELLAEVESIREELGTMRTSDAIRDLAAQKLLHKSRQSLLHKP